LIWSTQIKTGAEFDVNLGFSWKDKTSIEITIPTPWAQADAATGRIAWGGVEQLEREMAAGRVELTRPNQSNFSATPPRNERASDREGDNLRRIEELTKRVSELGEQLQHGTAADDGWTAADDATRTQEHHRGRGM
jgi:hypothetical protein